MKRRVTVVMVRVALPLASLMLGACGSTHYCVVEQDYQKTRIVPELQPTEGLELPQSAGALRLPPAPANPEPFGKPGGPDGANICLDQPPRMTTPVKPKDQKVSSTQ